MILAWFAREQRSRVALRRMVANAGASQVKEPFFRRAAAIVGISSVGLATGCGLTWSITVTCPSGSSSARDCSISGTIRPKSTSTLSDLSQFDASRLRASVDKSNVTLVGSNGQAGLKIRGVSGNLIASASFAWYRSGSDIYFTNPSQVSSWVQQNAGSGHELVVDWDELTAHSHNGANVVVFEVFYDEEVQAGDSTSWYATGVGLDPPQDPY